MNRSDVTLPEFCQQNLKEVVLERLRVQQAHRVVLITDRQVHAQHGQALMQCIERNGVNCLTLFVPEGEAGKTREVKEQLEDALFEEGIGRDAVLIALGGGSITDLVGFVAATYLRGLPVMYIPSTLLAMVDASIGGKTAINTAYGKNTLGVIRQPLAILVDVDYLKTLPDALYRDGFAEMIKHALLSSTEVLEKFSAHKEALMQREHTALASFIEHSALKKASFVEQDMHETGVRACLNLGHTVGHAIEKASGYQLSHGVSVALGLWAELDLAHALLGFPEQQKAQVERLIDFFFPSASLDGIDEAAVMAAMTYDKKCRQGRVRVVLLEAVGVVRCEGDTWAHAVDEAMLHQSIQRLYARFSS